MLYVYETLSIIYLLHPYVYAVGWDVYLRAPILASISLLNYGFDYQVFA